MIPHIIHNPDRRDRYDILMKELAEQGITEYKLCPAVIDFPVFRGIAQSFKNIVREAKERGDESVVIFEDDIKFTDKGAYDHWLKNEPDFYDIYFGGVFLGEILPGNVLKSFTALHCIMVHKRFYDTFLKANEFQHLDEALQGKGKYIVCYPMIAFQHDGFSDNAKKDCRFDSIIDRWDKWKAPK